MAVPALRPARPDRAALLKAALAALAAEGVDEVRACAAPNALAFYERHGFLTAGSAPSASIPGRSLPLMRWRRRGDRPVNLGDVPCIWTSTT